jgi:hypothetical protein
MDAAAVVGPTVHLRLRLFQNLVDGLLYGLMKTETEGDEAVLKRETNFQLNGLLQQLRLEALDEVLYVSHEWKLEGMGNVRNKW